MENKCDKETEIALIQASMTNINDKLDNIQCTLKNLEGKFAGKWTEKVLIFIGSVGGTSIIVSIMYLILK